MNYPCEQRPLSQRLQKTIAKTYIFHAKFIKTTLFKQTMFFILKIFLLNIRFFLLRFFSACFKLIGYGILLICPNFLGGLQ